MMYSIKFLSVSLLWFLLIGEGQLQAQVALQLDEAVQSKKIQIALRGKGCYQGPCMRMALKNLDDQAIELTIPPGQIFISEDSSIQNLMVTSEKQVVIQPKRSQIVDLFTMCIQSYNMSPQKGERFRHGYVADKGLLKLARLISEKGYQNSTSQAAVWSVANNDPVKNIYGEDTVMLYQLAGIVSEATETPLSEFRFNPRRHAITSINTSLEAYLDDYVRDLKLVLVDSNQHLVRTYFDGREYEPGFYQWKVGAHHFMGDDAKLFLRLYEGEQIVKEQLVQFGDSVAPTQQVKVEGILNYELADESTGRIGLYDEQDRLCFLLDDKRELKKGFNRTRVVSHTYLAPGHQYFLRLFAQGKELASTEIDMHQKAKPIYNSIKEQGQFVLSIDQPIHDARLAIYDEEGRVKRILYDIHHLNPGKKKISYWFTHHDGPDASFFARLTNAQGDTLWEKEL